MCVCVDIWVCGSTAVGVCVDVRGPCYYEAGEACEPCVLEVEGFAEQGSPGPSLALAPTGLCRERAGPAIHLTGELVLLFTSPGRVGLTPNVVQYWGEQVPPLNMGTGELTLITWAQLRLRLTSQFNYYPGPHPVL